MKIMTAFLALTLALSLNACAVSSNSPSTFVTENSVVKTRIKDRNQSRDIEYQFATTREFQTTSRWVGSEQAKSCEAYAQKYAAQTAGLDACSSALAEPALSKRNRQASLFNRGLIHMNMDNIDAAKQDFQTVLKEDPGFGDAYLSLGIMEANAQNYAQAKVLGDQALNLSTAQPDRVYVLLGWIAEHQFDFDGARAAYGQALDINPGSANARRKLKRLNTLWPETTQRPSK